MIEKLVISLGQWTWVVEFFGVFFLRGGGWALFQIFETQYPASNPTHSFINIQPDFSISLMFNGNLTISHCIGILWKIFKNSYKYWILIFIHHPKDMNFFKKLLAMNAYSRSLLFPRHAVTTLLKDSKVNFSIVVIIGHERLLFDNIRTSGPIKITDWYYVYSKMIKQQHTKL